MKAAVLKELAEGEKRIAAVPATVEKMVKAGIDVCLEAEAGLGEILCSSTVKELVTGSDLSFVDRGRKQLKGVPRDEWVRTPVRRIMTPAASVTPLAPDDDVVTALEAMVRGDAGRLPVVVGGRIVGILSRRDVMQLFQIRSDLSA